MVTATAPEQTDEQEQQAEVTDPPKRGRGRPRAVRPEPQTAFDEMTIASAEIVEQLDIYVENAEAASAAAKAKRTAKDLLKAGDYPEGRYRIGEHVIDWKPRNGGGFSVPAWSAMGLTVVKS